MNKVSKYEKFHTWSWWCEHKHTVMYKVRTHLTYRCTWTHCVSKSPIGMQTLEYCRETHIQGSLCVCVCVCVCSYENKSKITHTHTKTHSWCSWWFCHRQVEICARTWRPLVTALCGAPSRPPWMTPASPAHTPRLNGERHIWFPVLTVSLSVCVCVCVCTTNLSSSTCVSSPLQLSYSDAALQPTTHSCSSEFHHHHKPFTWIHCFSHWHHVSVSQGKVPVCVTAPHPATLQVRKQPGYSLSAYVYTVNV